MRNWPVIIEALTRGCTLRELAKAIDVTERTARTILKMIRASAPLEEAVLQNGRKHYRLVGEYVPPNVDEWSDAERELIQRGRPHAAAKALGVSVRTIYRERKRLSEEG